MACVECGERIGSLLRRVWVTAPASACHGRCSYARRGARWWTGGTARTHVRRHIRHCTHVNTHAYPWQPMTSIWPS